MSGQMSRLNHPVRSVIRLSLASLVVVLLPSAAQATVTTLTLEQGQGITSGQTSISKPSDETITSSTTLLMVITDAATSEHIYSVQEEGRVVDLSPGPCSPSGTGWICGSTPWTGYTWNGLTDGATDPDYLPGVVAPAGQVLPVGSYDAFAGWCPDASYTGCGYSVYSEVKLTVVAPQPKPVCSDGVDNDGDGLIDYPNDPGCTSATDTNESNPAVRTISLSVVRNPLRVKGRITSTDIACESSQKVQVYKGGVYRKTVISSDSGAFKFAALRNHKYTTKLPASLACTGASKSITP